MSLQRRLRRKIDPLKKSTIHLCELDSYRQRELLAMVAERFPGAAAPKSVIVGDGETETTVILK